MNQKYVKKLFSFIVAITMSLIMTLSSFAYQFDDTYGHWANTSIDKWSDLEVIRGFGGLFRPDDLITLAEFSSILSQVMGYVELDNGTYNDLSPEDWYYSTMLKVVAAGVVNSDKEGFLNPQAFLTRQGIAAMLAKAFKIPMEGLNTSFVDDLEIPMYVKSYINSMHKKGYISGYQTDEGYEFGPHNYVTRAEAITMVDRIASNLINSPGVYVQNITGNLIINSPDVTLEDMVIDGNLYLAEGIGNGEVTLKNVLVRGDTIVRGGGNNSVYIIDSVLGNVLVDKSDGEIRIIATGNTRVSVLTLESGAVVITSELEDGRIEVTTIPAEVRGDQPIVLVGTFETVTNNAKDLDIEVTGNIKNLIITADTNIKGDATIENSLQAPNTNVNKSGNLTVLEDNSPAATATPAPVPIASPPGATTAPPTVPETTTAIQTQEPPPPLEDTYEPPLETIVSVSISSTVGSVSVGGSVSFVENVTLNGQTIASGYSIGYSLVGSYYPGTYMSGGTLVVDANEIASSISVVATVLYNSVDYTSNTVSVDVLTASNSLAQAKEKKISELFALVSNLTESDYTVSSWGAVISALTTARLAVEALTDINDVNSYDYSALKTVITDLVTRMPGTLSTNSKVIKTEENPSIVVSITDNSFAGGITDPTNWTFSAGTTGLTIGSITKNSDTKVTINFTGIAAPGTLSLAPKAEVMDSKLAPPSLSTTINNYISMMRPLLDDTFVDEGGSTSRTQALIAAGLTFAAGEDTLIVGGSIDTSDLEVWYNPSTKVGLWGRWHNMKSVNAGLIVENPNPEVYTKLTFTDYFQTGETARLDSDLNWLVTYNVIWQTVSSWITAPEYEGEPTYSGVSSQWIKHAPPGDGYRSMSIVWRSNDDSKSLTQVIYFDARNVTITGNNP